MPTRRELERWPKSRLINLIIEIYSESKEEIEEEEFEDAEDEPSDEDGLATPEADYPGMFEEIAEAIDLSKAPKLRAWYDARANLRQQEEQKQAALLAKERDRIERDMQRLQEERDRLEANVNPVAKTGKTPRRRLNIKRKPSGQRST